MLGRGRGVFPEHGSMNNIKLSSKATRLSTRQDLPQCRIGTRLVILQLLQETPYGMEDHFHDGKKASVSRFQARQCCLRY